MKFDKEVLFLGISANELKDGGEPVTVNVGNGDRSAEMVQVLLSLEFGDRLRATFFLRPADKLYKLGLSAVSVC